MITTPAGRGDVIDVCGCIQKPIFEMLLAARYAEVQTRFRVPEAGSFAPPPPPRADRGTITWSCCHGPRRGYLTATRVHATIRAMMFIRMGGPRYLLAQLFLGAFCITGATFAVAGFSDGLPVLGVSGAVFSFAMGFGAWRSRRNGYLLDSSSIAWRNGLTGRSTGVAFRDVQLIQLGHTKIVLWSTKQPSRMAGLMAGRARNAAGGPLKRVEARVGPLTPFHIWRQGVGRVGTDQIIARVRAAGFVDESMGAGLFTREG